MRFFSRRIMGITGVLVAFLGGLALWAFWSWPKSPPARVVYHVERGDIAHTLQLTGRVTPHSSIVVAPRQSGRIVEIKVKEGDLVQAGDLLFTMRLETEGRSELLQKRAEVRRLQMEVAARAQRLKEREPVRDLIGLESVRTEETELDKMRVDLNLARERLALFEDELGLGRGSRGPASKTAQNGLFYIHAPSRGMVTLIDKRPGDFVAGGAQGENAANDQRTVMILADMTELVVKTKVLEADLRYVQKGAPVWVRVDAYPDAVFDGRVTHVAGQGRLDFKAGYTYFEVEIALDQKDERVLPEMNASVTLLSAHRSQTLTLPVAAVAILPDRGLVHVPDAHDPRGYLETVVQVGLVNEERVEILSGLSDGAAVYELDFAALQLDGFTSGGAPQGAPGSVGPSAQSPRSQDEAAVQTQPAKG